MRIKWLHESLSTEQQQWKALTYIDICYLLGTWYGMHVIGD
jgi:hypothetical protein